LRALTPFRACFPRCQVDFTGEAANTEAAAVALAHRPDVLVPRVIRSLSTSRVLVTAFVDNLVRVDDAAALAAAGLRSGDVGALLASTFAEMALCHGRVHGDPHAGNVYVRPLAEADAAKVAAARGPAGALAMRVSAAAGAAAGKAAGALRAAAPGAPAPALTTAATRVADALAAAAAALEPPAASPQLVLLDHGLYHSLDDDARHALCRLYLACARADAAAMRSASETLARIPGSPLARFFPLVLSHWFIFGVGVAAVTPAELAAAREGRMPPGLTLADLSDFLTGLHGAGGNILGVVHSLGYTRGLLNGLAFPERRRLRALASFACVGLAPKAAHPPAAPVQLRARAAAAALHVDALAWALLPALALSAPLLHGVVIPLRAALPADLAALIAFVLIALVAALAGALTRADHPRLI
jgi:hypothetical protein